MTDKALLPHSSADITKLMEQVTIEHVEMPVDTATIWQPNKASVDLLPYVAANFSVDFYDDAWSDAGKREVSNDSFEVHRQKGTKQAIIVALKSLGLSATIEEWFEKSPQGTPGTGTINVKHGQKPLSDREIQLAKRVIDNVKRKSFHYADKHHMVSDVNYNVAVVSVIGDFISIAPKTNIKTGRVRAGGISSTTTQKIK